MTVTKFVREIESGDDIPLPPVTVTDKFADDVL
jgi:hypothetical protein